MTKLDELSNNKSSWTTNDKKQPGYWFSGSSSYKSSVPQVFFPAAGVRGIDGTAGKRGRYGDYWSSGPSIYYAYGLCFYGSDVDMDNYNRACGNSVRCVQITDEVAEL